MNNLMQLTEIIKLYTKFFSINSVTSQKTIDLYSENEVIARVKLNEPGIFEYKHADTWRKCKTTDLITLILHDCPLHGA